MSCPSSTAKSALFAVNVALSALYAVNADEAFATATVSAKAALGIIKFPLSSNTITYHVVPSPAKY